jgi:hypothetical protein
MSADYQQNLVTRLHRSSTFTVLELKGPHRWWQDADVTDAVVSAVTDWLATPTAD